MARTRNLKPGFFTNDRLADIDPLGRLLFQGLWCVADREGRLEDRPRKLKVTILPYDDCDINALLDELQNGGFILRYTADENQYIQVLAFERHQHPHQREHESAIPAPDKPESSRALTLNPSSLTLNPDKCANATSDATADATPEKRTEPPAERQPAADSGFDEFWLAYPKKRDKAKAKKAYLKAVKTVSLHTMLAALSRQKRSADWVKEGGKYVPYPSSWLNGERWDDEVSAGPPPAGGFAGAGVSPGMAVLKELAR
jgi:hypothetical protein